MWTVDSTAGRDAVYLREGGAFESWTVMPQFQKPAVRLTGRNRGSGVKTELEFEFNMLSPANKMYLFSEPYIRFDDIFEAEIEVVGLAERYGGVGESYNMFQKRKPLGLNYYEPAIIGNRDINFVGVLALDNL